MRQRIGRELVTGPVLQRQPICESDRERVFDVPFSDLFRSEVVTPDGTVRVFDGIRAYVDSIQVDDKGRIAVQVRAKSRRIGDVKVPYPYHFLDGDVMCALKINEMRMKSDVEAKTFGLTYNLLCLPWSVCVLVHKYRGDGVPMVAVTSRGEWEHGEMNAYNREVQIFISVANERQMPLDMARAVSKDGVAKWMEDCQREIIRKRL